MIARAGRLVVRCPAKVNLALRVIGARRDGYHEIRTVFQAIDLCDTLVLEPSAAFSLSCDDPRLATDESNLVARAARVLEERAGVPVPARVDLRKRIPIGGGLGGGSSDAAGALVGLTALHGLPLEIADLDPLAARLGSDVPFFLRGGTAEGAGRGEKIAPLAFAGPLRLLLGLPPFGVSTAEAYAWADAHLTLADPGVSLKRSAADKFPEDNDFRWGVNDLEPGVFERHPGMERFRDALLGSGARLALLSGSGSTVFGVFDDSGSLRRAAEDLAARFPEWRLVPVRAVQDAVGVTEAGGPS